MAAGISQRGRSEGSSSAGRRAAAAVFLVAGAGEGAGAAARGTVEMPLAVSRAAGRAGSLNSSGTGAGAGGDSPVHSELEKRWGGPGVQDPVATGDHSPVLFDGDTGAAGPAGAPPRGPAPGAPRR